MDRDHFSNFSFPPNFSFPQSKEAPYEIWAKLAQGLQEKSFENVNGTDTRKDGWKVITIAHPEIGPGHKMMSHC